MVSGTAMGLTVATTALGIKTSTAHAAAPNYNCETGEVCLFENNNYNENNTNHVYQWTGKDELYNNNVWYNSSDGLNDEASSVKNNGGGSFNVTLYQHEGGGGAHSTYAPGSGSARLGNNNIGDNRASSHYWTHV
ncbi:peptidase inhibitor family I36 protein [Spirillospora sp. NPDC047279]|uniref:peptidase inhibitor family I36 protein n=1 Tax=Spirillospora sp. NPDC047279 TaxID=3155478 RepID=UPI0033F47598